MRYHWEDFSLDIATSSLARHGKRIETAPRVVDCIGYLIAHRERVVGHDELIRKLWGHVNVTNHQLAQVVLAARRILGDDGQLQLCIRTVPGRGYHWVGPLADAVASAVSAPKTQNEPEPPAVQSPASEQAAAQILQSPSLPADANEAAAVSTTMAGQTTAAQPAPALAPPRSGDTATASVGTSRYALIACGVVLALLVVWYALHGAPGRPETPTTDASADPVAALKKALWMGRLEDVREGLAKLPPGLVDSADARFLELELELLRGRYERADGKLVKLETRAEMARDPVWRARTLVYRSQVNYWQEKPVSDVLEPAQSAVGLLTSMEKDVPPGLLASALKTRAVAYIQNEQISEAEHDLLRARDLFVSIDDTRNAIEVESALTRVWMRTGRMQEALDVLSDVSESFRRLQDSIREILARNRMTRIQAELLRWDDALANNDRSMMLLRQVPDLDRRYRNLSLRAMVLIGKGRLYEAAAMLDEAEQIKKEDVHDVTIALFHLESGDPAAALEVADKLFVVQRDLDTANILLDSKDGALLMWITAAQALVSAGQPMPKPSDETLQRLRNPATSLAHIASGRWLWLQGKTRDAETELRLALSQARQLNQLYRMTLAAEPLIELLLLRGDTAAAQTVYTDLRTFRRDAFDGDYHANLMGLRIALDNGEGEKISAAYRKTRMLAGQRTLPLDVSRAYAERMRTVADGSESRSAGP